jgi:hypothetical protein
MPDVGGGTLTRGKPVNQTKPADTPSVATMAEMMVRPRFNDHPNWSGADLDPF